jgi:hypothetical protein
MSTILKTERAVYHIHVLHSQPCDISEAAHDQLVIKAARDTQWQPVARMVDMNLKLVYASSPCWEGILISAFGMEAARFYRLTQLYLEGEQMAARSNDIWPRRAGILFLACWEKHLRKGVTNLNFRQQIHLEPYMSCNIVLNMNSCRRVDQMKTKIPALSGCGRPPALK